MKTVLILNFPAEGHVNPTLGITKAFSDKGYDCLLYTSDAADEG